MVQRWVKEQYLTEQGHWATRPGVWVDWSSQDEGEYPEHDAQAKRAVKCCNAWRRARILKEKATDLERRAANFRYQALIVCKKVGIQGP